MLWIVCVALFFLTAIIAAISPKASKVLRSFSWYKKWFARNQQYGAKIAKTFFEPFKRKLFLDLEEHLKRVNGNVLEIGIGAGANFDYYPQDTSLIAVDSNPHTEELLKENLKKFGERIHLKKFVAASAEDMSCRGEVGVEDNSVAAVVCTNLCCSLTDDQTKKTIQEVKRVLVPGGRFYFVEHVAGKPWTFQYFVQHFLSRSLIWPTLLGGCRCNRETLSWIEDGGFKMVKSEKKSANLTPEMFLDSSGRLSSWNVRIRMSIVNSILIGFAEKEQYFTKEKKLL